ncbi:hypothetical protein EWM64_g9119 [Hericium alpestre]|uniref:Uncharacterized protein n=1 Tax=Hericium alpestre TaxID=135208 RepID=A0A4Y9ZLQ9_9AGAM|nr:hypothetical protein EWM64_g9119 [Hericium alpestre]
MNTQAWLTKTRIVSLASDSEARQGKALIQLTFKDELSMTSPIYHLLSPLTLMDLHVGNDDVTPDKDYKHVFKRLRNSLLRKKGILIKDVWLTPSIIKAHFRDAGKAADHIRAIFNPDDKQDVTLAYGMLQDIWTLPWEPGSDTRAGF